MLSHVGCVCGDVCSRSGSVHCLRGGGIGGVRCGARFGKCCLSCVSVLGGLMGVARSEGQLCFEMI